MVVYAGCPRGAEKKRISERKFPETSKKRLTNRNGYAKMTQLAQSGEQQESAQKSLKKLEKSS